MQLSSGNMWGKKKKSTPNHLSSVGIKKELLLLTHAGCKDAKTPISPTTKHETSRKMENTHKMKGAQKKYYERYFQPEARFR